MFRIFLTIIIIISNIYSEDGNKSMKIFVLMGYHDTLPWNVLYKKGLNEFKQNYKGKIDFFIENMDVWRLNRDVTKETWKSYLKDKYHNIDFDGIIVVSDKSYQLYESIVNELYLDIPSVVTTSKDNIKYGTLHFKIYKKEMAEKTIKLAKIHNSYLKKAYIIKSDDLEGIRVEKELIKNLKAQNIEVKILDFSMSELKKFFSTIPKDSAVFFTILFEDKSGDRFIPKDALREIAESSNAPVYSFYKSLLGSGTIGGYMEDGEKIGYSMVSELVNYIKYKKISKKTETLNLIIDFEVMKRFGIDSSINPKETIFINKPIPIWESHPKETFYAIFLIFILTILFITFLLLYLKNKKMKEIEKQLLLKSKLASMGEMINNIAHQWRQPLNEINSIVMALDYVCMQKNIVNSDIENNLKNIEKQTEYMSNTIDNFRNYFKPSKEKEVFTLSLAINNSIKILDSVLKQNNINLSISTIDDKEIYGYFGEYIQVIISIIQNSKDAFLEKNIENRNLNIVIDNNIYIEDNAGGIKNDVFDKIFEPYFSTKHSIHGTGIGLYMSKMIIEESMDGKLYATRVDNGTKFTIEV